MSERDRQSSHERSQPSAGQHDEGHRGNQGYDSPRQANQWQAEGSRQAGGNWQQDSDRDQRAQDPYRFSGQSGGHLDVGNGPRQRNEDDWHRADQRDARNYQQDRQNQRPYDHAADRANADYRSGYGRSSFEASGGNDFGSFTSEDYGGRDFSSRSGGGVTGGLHPSDTYRPSYGLSSWGRHDSRSGRDDHDYGSWREFGESRGFLARAGDEVASWFGSEDAARRREQDRRDDHAGRGPSGYTRSDERIREDANDHLTHDRSVDATHVTVSVNNGEVTLDGTVDSREAKRRAEDAVDRVSGVKHVQNNLRVRDGQNGGQSWSASANANQTTGAATTATAGTSGSTARPGDKQN